MPYSHGKFVKPGSPSMGKPVAKPAPKAAGPGTPEHEKVHGKAQAPQGAGSQEKHVTETHPGKTQPHPMTGVHAHHSHHTGEHAAGGPAYTSHTHHDDGTVETKDNQTHDEMMASHDEAFPAEQGGMPQREPMGEPPDAYADMMNGIGGNEGSAV